MSTFYEDVQALVQNQQDIYVADYHLMISHYNGERKTSKDYKGREIFEMLQNADDAQSKEILLELDRTKNTVTISNKGEFPFEVAGIRSLMIPDLSSKTKKKFIGNKGLGFRSVLNWAEKIRIETQGVALSYSKQFCKQWFLSTFSDELRTAMLLERDLTNDTIPVALLSMPEVKLVAESTHGWLTRIELTYTETALEGIKKSLIKICEEALLFLNHVEKIVIKIDDEIVGYHQVENKGKNCKQIGERIWHIVEDEQPLPEKFRDLESNEIENYQVKIAITNDLSDKINRLFTYLPTEVELDLPMVVHASLDLNNSRNHLLESDKNRFVLEKVVDLMASAIKQYFQTSVDWRPYQLLSFTSKSGDLEKNGFYEFLKQMRDHLAIYPCLDGKYRTIKEVVWYCEEFSQFVMEVNAGDLFPNMLKPLVGLRIGVHTIPSMKDFVMSVNQLSQRIGKDFIFRTKLISILAKHHSHDDSASFSLLLGKNGKLIDAGTSVFTHISRGSEVPILPEYVNVAFLSPKLFDLLTASLPSEETTEKSRQLQQSLKKIAIIESYEPLPLIRKIVSETKKAIKNDFRQRKKYVQQMLQSLYYFRMNRRKGKALPQIVVEVKITSREGRLVEVRNCFLGKDYPSGILTEDLFGKVYEKAEFVAGKGALGLEKETAQDVEEFLLWLGVNKHTKFIPAKSVSGYEKFVFDHSSRPTGFRHSQVTATTVYRFENICKMLSSYSVKSHPNLDIISQ